MGKKLVAVLGGAGPLGSGGSGASGNVLTFLTTKLPTGTAGTYYTTAVSASLTGTTFSVASGGFPTGITMSADGAITGTPSAAGDSTVYITATNGSQTLTAGFLISIMAVSAPSTGGGGTTVNLGGGGLPLSGTGNSGGTNNNKTPPGASAPLTITTTSVPAGKVGTAYGTGTPPKVQITASTMTGTTFAIVPNPNPKVTDNGLPPGITLSGAGALTGTPTDPGTYKFTVQASNGTGTATATATQSYSCSVSTAAGTPSNPTTKSSPELNNFVLFPDGYAMVAANGLAKAGGVAEFSGLWTAGKDAASAGGRIVVAEATGKIWVGTNVKSTSASPSWTQTANLGMNCKKVLTDGSTFVVVGDTGIAYSSDGVSWATIPLATFLSTNLGGQLSGFTSLFYQPGLTKPWVVVGSGAAGQKIVSAGAAFPSGPWTPSGNLAVQMFPNAFCGLPNGSLNSGTPSATYAPDINGTFLGLTGWTHTGGWFMDYSMTGNSGYPGYSDRWAYVDTTAGGVAETPNTFAGNAPNPFPSGKTKFACQSNVYGGSPGISSTLTLPSSMAANIAAGHINFTLGGSVVSASASGTYHCQLNIKLVCYDSTGATISTPTFSSDQNSKNSWTAFSITGTLPTNTSSVKIQVLGTVDAPSLMVMGVADFSLSFVDSTGADVTGAAAGGKDCGVVAGQSFGIAQSADLVTWTDHSKGAAYGNIGLAISAVDAKTMLVATDKKGSTVELEVSSDYGMNWTGHSNPARKNDPTSGNTFFDISYGRIWLGTGQYLSWTDDGGTTWGGPVWFTPYDGKARSPQAICGL